MKNINHIQILLYCCMILLSGCKKDDGAGCFISAGPVTTEERQAGSFNRIEIYDNVDLVLTQTSGNNAIKVEAGENLQNGIRTDIEGNKLVIKNNNWCDWTRSFYGPIKVFVSVQQLDSISYHGSGDIECYNELVNDSIRIEVWEGAGSIGMKVNLDKLYVITHQGTVDITVSGNVWVNIVGSGGFGPIDCSGLKSEYTYINTSSPNDCYVYAKQLLSGEINNIGDVYYTGDPNTIGVTTTSSGKLINMD